eukprot:2984799-Amphidinium_carterae.1
MQRKLREEWRRKSSSCRQRTSSCQPSLARALFSWGRCRPKPRYRCAGGLRQTVKDPGSATEEPHILHGPCALWALPPRPTRCDACYIGFLYSH